MRCEAAWGWPVPKTRQEDLPLPRPRRAQRCQRGALVSAGKDLRKKKAGKSANNKYKSQKDQDKAANIEILRELAGGKTYDLPKGKASKPKHKRKRSRFP